MGTLTAPVTANASIIYNQGTIVSEKTGAETIVTESYDNVEEKTIAGSWTPQSTGTTTAYNEIEVAAVEQSWFRNLVNFMFRS